MSNAHAQMDKKEKKEWKKRAKAYSKDPESFKILVEEHQKFQGDIARLQADNNNLKSRMSDKDAKISNLEDDMAKLRSDLGRAKAEAREARAAAAAKPAEPTGSGRMIKGVVFKVQIGAFRNKDLSKYFENHENFSGETDEDGTQKITLSQFTDYWEADTFKKYLREMGVKDAWIVPYRDGVRVSIKDVLEGVISEDGNDTEGE
ncbi:MAG: Ezrin/radixin/moesin family protein [Cyclobacteriaceae bacterium]|nr:Ezrin/radixin/moesin family protein [Cyclobacteriaceae bacterium]